MRRGVRAFSFGNRLFPLAMKFQHSRRCAEGIWPRNKKLSAASTCLQIRQGRYRAKWGALLAQCDLTICVLCSSSNAHLGRAICTAAAFTWYHIAIHTQNSRQRSRHYHHHPFVNNIKNKKVWMRRPLAHIWFEGVSTTQKGVPCLLSGG